MLSPIPWLSRTFHRQRHVVVYAAVTLALLASLFTLTWWAVSSMASEMSASNREMARYARQRALVSSLQEALVEARRVESSLLHQGSERAAGYKRWDAAVASARRSLASLSIQTDPGERTIVHEAQRQLESYASLLDRVWLPPGTPGAPANPAPLVSRAGDYMIAVLQSTVHLGAMARTRTEVSQEATRALMKSVGSLGTTLGWWLLGVVVIVAALVSVGLRLLARAFKHPAAQPRPSEFAEAAASRF
jgi:hypothetical protein